MAGTSQTVLIVGATGYLGKHLITAFHRAGYRVHALARRPEALAGLAGQIDAIVTAQATQPATLRGVMADVDIVISALGITRQRDGLTYEDVDYQANMNLLDEAKRAGVSRFAYVHVKNAEALPNVAMAAAKSRFAAALQEADIASTIIRPSGFFSDLAEVLEMARRGRVYLFGDGSAPMSPIDGADLANASVAAIKAGSPRIEIGGPETLTQNEIAEAAFAAIGQPARISHIPARPVKWLFQAAKFFGLGQSLGALDFFVNVSQLDMSAPAHGSRTLAEFYEGLADAQAADPAHSLAA
ncbi:MAG: SDR family oxidoreductase [Pseudomonadota bacterium]